MINIVYWQEVVNLNGFARNLKATTCRMVEGIYNAFHLAKNEGRRKWRKKEQGKEDKHKD